MATETKPDQAEMVAGYLQMTAALAGVKLSLPDLISQHASLSANKATVDGEVAKLTGDKTKLVAGATVPTDLVSAGNTISALTTERDGLKATATTVEAAAAKKIVELGFTTGGKKEEAASGGKKATLTEKILAAKGVKTLAELNTKCDAERAQSVPDKSGS